MELGEHHASVDVLLEVNPICKSRAFPFPGLLAPRVALVQRGMGGIFLDPKRCLD